MLSLRCFSLQLLTTEVNLFNHCRREQQLQDRPCTNPGLFIPGVCVKAGKAAAGCLEGMHPRNSSFQFGFPEIWLKVVGMEGDSSWGCQGEAVAAAQAAQKLWWQGFQYYGCSVCCCFSLSLFIVWRISQFLLHAAKSQSELHQWEKWVLFQSVPGCPCSGELGGESTNSSESWARGAQGHLSSLSVPDSEQTIVMTSLGWITPACTVRTRSVVLINNC